MKNLLSLILVLISVSAFAQKMECAKFKDGKFKIVDPEFGTSYIDRKGSKQTEYGEGSGLKLEFEVSWLDECTYTLKLTKVLANPKKIELPKGMILTIKITETKENSYVQKTSSSLYDVVLESEMIRID